MPNHNTKQQLRKSLKPDGNQISTTFRDGYRKLRFFIVFCFKALGLRSPKQRWLRRIIGSLILIIIISIIGMFGIAQWYIHSEQSKPLQLGVSFIPDYAESLGVNPEQAMDALLHIGVKQFRLTSYWSDIEPTPGHYDFSQLDWEFQKAQSAHAAVILTVGLRQPRWPECHLPTWAATEPESIWEPQLLNVMQAVVDRYKNSPSLKSYQVENEYFLQGFGACTNFSRTRLIVEDNLVKTLDPHHPIIIARSNNALGFPVGQPIPSEFSITVYKRVWDAGVTHRYFEYPFPAWFYGFLAGTQKILLHKDMIIGELQAEAWPPHGQTIPMASLNEQNKSFNAAVLEQNIAYSKATGMRQIELWGAEYWYYRLVVLHDQTVWNAAKQEFQTNS